MMLKKNSASTRLTARPFLALLLVATALFLSACTGLWFLVQDPENLPCAPDGECLAGYVCIDEVCRRAEAKGVGETCTIDSECESRICADAYDPEFCGDQLSCQTIGRTQADYRCRAPCSGTNVDVRQECASGERCHQVTRREENQLFCQEGVCDVDSDCGINSNVNPDQRNLCVGAAVNVGESGTCARGCDPLQCNPDTGCTGCPQSEASCENVDFAAPDRFGCLPPGVARAGELCDFVQNFCAPGSFCPSTAPGTVCVKFCNANGGAPACEGAQLCSPIAGTDGVGFCQ